MDYYTLRQDDRIPDHPKTWRCSDNIDPEDWLDGKVPPDPGLVRITLSPRSSEKRSHIISGLVTIFHKRFISELVRLGVDNFQHFPVEMEAPDGMIEKAYSIINVIGLIEAVDRSKSVIEDETTHSRGWLKSFKIDSAKAKGLRLFRLVEAPTLIVIDHILWLSLSEFKPAGVIMLPTERYDGW